MFHFNYFFRSRVFFLCASLCIVFMYLNLVRLQMKPPSEAAADRIINIPIPTPTATSTPLHLQLPARLPPFHSPAFDFNSTCDSFDRSVNPLPSQSPLKYAFAPECHSVCRFTWPSHRGPPSVAFPDQPIADFLCSATYRDLADFVFSFPFGHFGESPAVPDFHSVGPCLPAGSIIYVQTGPGLADFCSQMFPAMKNPFILITGQSDYNPSSWCGDQSSPSSLLNSPLLIHWFAQNNDLTHPKVSILPIGLNCWEHQEIVQAITQNRKRDETAAGNSAIALTIPSVGNENSNLRQCSFERHFFSELMNYDSYRFNEQIDRLNQRAIQNPHNQSLMEELRKNLKGDENNRPTVELPPPFSIDKLALANFGLSSWGGRESIKSSLCGQTDSASWLGCKTFNGLTNAVKGNPHLIDLYYENHKYLFHFCPRGNGIDTHRVWEALYLGAVPILEHSILDPIFNDPDLPVLLVDDMKAVNREFLLAHATRFTNIARDFPRRKLSRDYWIRKIYSVRRKFLGDKIDSKQMIFELERERRRCWGN